MTICFATNNSHKLEEVRAVLGEALHLKTLSEIGCLQELPETQDTVEGNAKQKAHYVWDHFNVPCFADDTGLEVDVLHGAPGVHSARFAGPQRSSEDNIALLLDKLKDIPERQRLAQFRTVIALILPQGEWLFEGVVKGTILGHRRGKGGFGYDPVFQPQGSHKTLAEMTMMEKNEVSHRAIAVKKLAEFLQTS